MLVGSASPGCVKSAGCHYKCSPWAWNSFLCNGGSKGTPEGLLGDSSQMNSSFLKRTAVEQLPPCFLNILFCTHFQQQQMNLMTSEAFPIPHPGPLNIWRDVQTCSTSVDSGLELWMLFVGFLNLSIVNQLLHRMNLCGLISTFPKSTFQGDKTARAMGSVGHYHSFCNRG